MADGAPLPAWAAWSAAAAARPWTVGIEEETMLLEPGGARVANRIDDVLSALPSAAAEHAAVETHACVAELLTDPHPTVAEAAEELARLRVLLDRTARDALGLWVAAAGTHPLATRTDVALSSQTRYREVAASTRALARREPTMAQHVHVAVPDAETAVRALDGLRGDIPMVLALAANSPYWRGSDSGFASVRTPIFSAFPRTGIARAFGSYAAYVAAIDPLLRAGVIREPGFLWWDARLQPRLGTLEVRVMDAQSRPEDMAALAAVVQCLVRRHADGDARAVPGPEVLAENRFLAARDGMAAELMDDRGGRRPVRDILFDRLAECAAAASELGCTAELASAAQLASEPGADRQRAYARRFGVVHVAAALAEEFTAGDAAQAQPLAGAHRVSWAARPIPDEALAVPSGPGEPRHPG